MQRTIINQKVSVTAVYFKNTHNFETFPRRIEYDGKIVSFADGIRYLIRKGEQLVQLFDMSDGTNQYRLREESEQWTLVAIS